MTTATFDRGAICTAGVTEVDLQLLFHTVKSCRERYTEFANLCRDAVCNVHARAARSPCNPFLVTSLQVLHSYLYVHP